MPRLPARLTRFPLTLCFNRRPGPFSSSAGMKAHFLLIAAKKLVDYIDWARDLDATHSVIFGHRLSENFEPGRSGATLPRWGCYYFKGFARVTSKPVCQLRRAQKAHLMRRQGAILGLLIAAIFVGSIDVALRAYSAIGTQPQTEKVASVKIQDRLTALVVEDSQKAVGTSTSLGAVKPLHTPDPSASNPGSDVTGVFSVSNIHPTDGFVTAPATRPAASTHPNLAVSSTPASPSRIASHLVSLPTRKPKRPIAKEPPSSTAELKAKAEGQEEGGPKPLAFGSIGYNYNPQQ